MKKNMMVIGMLVALLTIPANMFAQEVVSTDTALAAQDTVAAVQTADTVAKKVREPRVQKIDSLHYSYGSVVSAHFGMGMSGMWASEGTAKLQNSWGFPGFNVGLRYSYYFLSWLGFTTGLDYSSYTSTITMTGVMDWNSGVKNLLGEEYLHRLNFTKEGKAQSSWKEVEDMGMVEIPIALSFKYKPNKVGLISTLGLKVGFPVKGRYRYEGVLNHSGYSAMLDYTQWNDQYFLANDIYKETYKDYKKGTWSVVNAEVFGEIGALFQVHERVDLSLSVYGSYGVNDVNATAYKDRQELGFRTAEQAMRNPNMNVACMNAYQGLIGTKAIDKLNPWNCGVKIGVHFYCGKENDAERAARLAAITTEAVPTIVYVRDTVTLTDTVETIIHDTVVDVHKQVTKMLEKVIIYYKSGDAKTPIISPASLLDDAAAIIAANPQIRVSVEGHASSDGNPDYNQMLSQSRAMNVAKVLRDKGVKDSQIEIRAYGSDHPLKFGDQNDKNKDRRVEIIPIEQ